MGSNYTTWRREINNALKSKHKMFFVDGSLLKPNQGDPNKVNWNTCNTMIMAWILNSSEQFHDHVVYHDTTYAIWKEVKARFPSGNGPRLQEIKRELINIHQGDMHISTYNAKMKVLWKQLNALSTPHNTRCLTALMESPQRRKKRKGFLNFFLA